LAKEVALDLEKPHKAAEVVQKIGATHGVELPSKSDTLADKLKQVQNLLESQ